jgi:hypothetical protein
VRRNRHHLNMTATPNKGPAQSRAETSLLANSIVWHSAAPASPTASMSRGRHNQDRPLFDRTIFPVPLELSSRNTPLRERQAWWISVHQVHSSTSAHNSRRGCGPQAPTRPITNNLQKSPTSPRSRGAWRGGNDTSPVIVRMNPHARRDLAISRVNNGHRLRPFRPPSWN